MQPSFSSFSDALSFIEKCLENGASSTLIDSCDPLPEISTIRQSQAIAIDKLANVHKKTSLKRRLQRHDFPSDDDILPIGGSDLERVAILFRREGERWVIMKIGMTRQVCH